MTFRTTGIVLQKRDFREADRIYTIYTADHGKLELVGKGTRKIVSKMASHLEPPSFVEFMVAEGKAIDYVAGVRRLATYNNIRTDFEAAFAFSRVAIIFDKEVKLGQKDDFLYSALTRFLDELNGAPPTLLLPDASFSVPEAPEALLAQQDTELRAVAPAAMLTAQYTSSTTGISDAFLTLLTNYTFHGIVPRLGLK